MVLPPQRPGPGAPPSPIYTPSSGEPGAPVAPAPRPSTHAAPPPQVPAVTLAIVISNVAVLALMVATGISFINPSAQDVIGWGANFGPRTMHGEWWRLITACWIHGGIIHLGFNMYVLWDLGRVTERIYGMVGYSIVYLVAGIGGSFLSVTLNPLVTSVGASGAVFGVAGAFLAFLLRNRTRIQPHIAQHLRRNLITFVVFNLMIGFAIPGIDQAGHVGGLITGFVAGLIVAPTVSAAGMERPHARYPIVAALGIAMLGICFLGIQLMPVGFGTQMPGW